MTFNNRTAIVTGAGRGIGKAIAELLAKNGVNVICVSKSPDSCGAVAAAIVAAGGKAKAVPVDVADSAAIAKASAALLTEFGKIDILVNNAAITRDGLAMRMKPDDWEAVLRTNLTGAHLCIQQVLPPMMKARAGRIINISSVVAESGNAGQANYVASKAGLIGLTKAIAIEIASRNITVNAVAPGFVESPMTAVLPDKVKEELKVRIPLGRMGTGKDVAASIVFLASDEAAYITGHVLDVNGGMYLA